MKSQEQLEQEYQEYLQRVGRTHEEELAWLQEQPDAEIIELFPSDYQT